MQDEEFWTAQFAEHRPRLRAVAYRMLGSFAEADDAVQETWLRISRASGDDVDNVGGWLTTVVSRQCLNMLRARANRREDPLEVRVPDPIVESGDGVDPAEQAAMADSVSLALLVVLEALDPAERLAFVLHDMFAMPFDDIAPMVGRTPAAARQLASRARRRVQGADPVRAARSQAAAGDRRCLDGGRPRRRSRRIGGAAAPGRRPAGRHRRRRLDDRARRRRDRRPGRDAPGSRGSSRGSPSSTAARASWRRIDGRPTAVLAFTVADGLIVEVDILTDPRRLAALNLPS